MKLQRATAKKLVVTDVPGMDPIHVYTEDYGPGQGRIAIACGFDAMSGCWMAMGTATISVFFSECNSDYLLGKMVGLRRLTKTHTAHLLRIIETVQAAFRNRAKGRNAAIRAERLEHANSLIRIISQHGRRFFWNEAAQRVARLELDERGKVWWVDDYRGTRVCTEKIGGYEHRWHGFSHGGTLKQLAQMMRDYIKTGERIHWGYIAPDCWAYDDGASKDTREAAAKLPIIKS